MHRLADRINVYFENDAVPLRLTYCGTQFKFENFASGFEYELFFYLLTERGIYSWELHVANLSTEHLYSSASNPGEQNVGGIALSVGSSFRILST